MAVLPTRSKWRCPGCGRQYFVPSTQGLTLCLDCTRKTAATATADPPKPAIDFPKISNLKTSIAVEKETVIDAEQETARYPNLERNLYWFELGAKIQLFGSIIIAGLLTIYAFFGGALEFLSDPFGRWSSPFAFLATMLFLLIVVVLPAWVLYVIALSLVEFVRLIMDIEVNTRATASHRSQAPGPDAFSQQ